jgi:hypothetical protein
MFLTKSACTIYVWKVNISTTSRERTHVSGKGRENCYTYRGISLIKYNYIKPNLPNQRRRLYNIYSDCKQCDLDLNAFNQSYSFSSGSFIGLGLFTWRNKRFWRALWLFIELHDSTLIIWNYGYSGQIGVTKKFVKNSILSCPKILFDQ